MNYWLVCLPREDLLHCMKVGTFGFSRKHILGNVVKGDSVVFCAGKGDWKVIATGNAISDYYLDISDIFLKEGIFPDRFDFEHEKLAPERQFCLISIIDQLSFVTNIPYWAVFFRNGIVKMAEQDWELINRKINQFP